MLPLPGINSVSLKRASTLLGHEIRSQQYDTIALFKPICPRNTGNGSKRDTANIGSKPGNPVGLSTGRSLRYYGCVRPYFTQRDVKTFSFACRGQDRHQERSLSGVPNCLAYDFQALEAELSALISSGQWPSLELKTQIREQVIKVQADISDPHLSSFSEIFHACFHSLIFQIHAVELLVLHPNRRNLTSQPTSKKALFKDLRS